MWKTKLKCGKLKIYKHLSTVIHILSTVKTQLFYWISLIYTIFMLLINIFFHTLLLLLYLLKYIVIGKEILYKEYIELKTRDYI